MEERLKFINEKAIVYLEDWLRRMEEGENPDELLASLYGGMIAARLLGYDPDDVAKEAAVAADKLFQQMEESDQEQTE